MTDSLPADVEFARVTDDFTESKHPAGLLRAHQVAAGVWGRLVVRSGSVGFVFEDTPDELITATQEHPVVIPPQRLHHVVLDGPAVFAVEFYKETAAQAVAEGSESSGLSERP